MPQTITAGSNSRLGVFEDCRLRAKLQFIDKIPEPPKPPRADGKEDPMERGARIHNEAEAYVKGTAETLAPELAKHYTEKFEMARNMFKEGKAVGEENWNFDKDWQSLPDPFASSPPDWNTFYKVKFRIKTDFTGFLSSSHALVVDYKTGKRFGNEVKHAEQLELYAIGAFLVYPQLELVDTELWYIDVNEVTSMTFTRTDALKRLKAWDERNEAMTTCDEFPPNPSMYTCKWCPYRGDRTGHCSVGIY